MGISDDKMRRITSDLGLNIQFVKGQDIAVRNCWHFTTDGSAIDFMFNDDEDFRLGMNRIYTTVLKYPDVVILAFCLMDTHVHFILYGDFAACNCFTHEYVRRTSMHISHKYGENNKMDAVPIRHQSIDTDRYLKNSICYTFRNPATAGICYSEYNYPWSSACLVPDDGSHWNSVNLYGVGIPAANISITELRKICRTRETINPKIRIIDGVIFPGEYVATDVVRKIFRSRKAFHFFMCSTKESDIESRGGAYSYLSIPTQEMRQHKTETCMELFGKKDIRTLNTGERIQLARTLKARYTCSPKQILRLCGLAHTDDIVRVIN